VVAGDSQDLNSASLRQQIEYLSEHDCGCAWNDHGILSSHFPEGFDEVIVRMAIEILLELVITGWLDSQVLQMVP
jgi:hypothetical protein